MKRWLVAACVMILASIGCQPSQDIVVRSDEIGATVTILGVLGLPVGQEATITGTKTSVGPIRDMFTVETINGEPAPTGLQIRVDGIASWPDDTRATLYGNEVGTVAYRHLYMTNYGPGDERWTGPHQELFLHFDVAEVVEPKGLEIDPTD